MHRLPIGLICWGIALSSTSAAEVKNLMSGRGIWVQAPQAFTKSDLEGLRPLGIRRIHIMLAASPVIYKSCATSKPQVLLAKPERLTNLVAMGKEAGMVVVVTAYIPPNRQAIELFTLASDAGLLQRLVAAGADAVEYDLEGGWSRSAVCGYTTHEDASKELLTRSRALKSGLPAGVTTHLGRVNDTKLGLGHADWVALQVYTKCDVKGGACVAFDDPSEGPGFRQSKAATSIRGYKGPVVMGLANYQQAWQGKTAADAMGKALDATSAVQREHPNFVGHTYWSTSWLGAPGVRKFMSDTAN